MRNIYQVFLKLLYIFLSFQLILFVLFPNLPLLFWVLIMTPLITFLVQQSSLIIQIYLSHFMIFTFLLLLKVILLSLNLQWVFHLLKWENLFLFSHCWDFHLFTCSPPIIFQIKSWLLQILLILFSFSMFLFQDFLFYHPFQAIKLNERQ